MAQAYTLKLNITADASSAVAEARRAQKELSALSSARSGGDTAGKAVGAAANAAPAAGCIPVLNAIRSDTGGILRALGGKGGGVGIPAAGGAGAFLGRTGSLFGAFLGKAVPLFGGMFSGILSAARGVVSFVRGAFSLCWRIPLQGLKALAVAIGALGGAAFAAKRLLDPAGKMQAYRAQLEVMVKDPRVAAARLAQLGRYARDTNYSPDEVIGAGNMLQAYGLYSFRTLKAAGDAANAFGRSIAEVVQTLSYLKGGRGGEAMESLSRFGVTRDRLREYGIRFGSQGQLKSSVQKTIRTVIRVFEDEYGGMTARIGKTWNGAVQQLGGEIFDALAAGFRRAVKPAVDFITGSVIPVVSAAGKALEGVDWERILRPLANAARGLSGIAAAWLDPRTRGMAEDPLRRLWNGAKAFGVAFTGGLGKMFSGAIESLAMTLGNFIGGGGVQKALAALGSVLALAGKAFIASVKTIFDAFPYRLRASLGLLLDRLPGVDTGVTRQRDAFLKPVYERIIRYPGEAARHAARDLGITADEYRQLQRQLLDSANRHSGGRQFGSLVEIDNLRGEYRDAARAWRHITGEGYLDKFYRRNFGLFLKHTGGAGNPMSHFADLPQQIERTLADIGQLFTFAAGSVETGPLRKAAVEAAAGLKQAFASGVAPALEAGRNLADYRAGKAGRYEFLRANYGEKAAEQWAAPYWEWRSKYPNGQRWNMKEYYRDRAEAARKQNEIFNGITSPKPQEERKRREEEQKARNRQEEQLASMQHTLDRLERALAPIARAYA